MGVWSHTLQNGAPPKFWYLGGAPDFIRAAGSEFRRPQGALTGALARRFPPAASQGGRGAPILLPKDCGFMRLDKWLKVSRLIKRRTVANEACDNERVSVNGRPARASYEVKVGDVIAIRFGERTLTVEVLSVQENAGKAEASALYREV